MDGSGYSDLLIKQVCFAAPSSQLFGAFFLSLMLRKILHIINALVLIGLPLSIYGQSSNILSDSAELSVSAKSFLSSWLVGRNVKEAMQFVAARPVLSSKCDLPPDVSKIPLSPKLKRKIVGRILSAGLKVFPKYESLDSAIEPSEIPASDWFNLEDNDIFQIIQIKPNEDGYLMCKFDESEEYRKAMLRPDVYYVSFKLKNMNDCPYYENWISLWAKEGQRWHLLSIGLLEN